MVEIPLAGLGLPSDPVFRGGFPGQGSSALRHRELARCCNIGCSRCSTAGFVSRDRPRHRGLEFVIRKGDPSDRSQLETLAGSNCRPRQCPGWEALRRVIQIGRFPTRPEVRRHPFNVPFASVMQVSNLRRDRNAYLPRRRKRRRAKQLPPHRHQHLQFPTAPTRPSAQPSCMRA